MLDLEIFEGEGEGLFPDDQFLILPGDTKEITPGDRVQRITATLPWDPVGTVVMVYKPAADPSVGENDSLYPFTHYKSNPNERANYWPVCLVAWPDRYELVSASSILEYKR